MMTAKLLKKLLGIVVVIWLVLVFINGLVNDIRHLPINPCDPHWWNPDEDVQECLPNK
jgi:hypothetical protein